MSRAFGLAFVSILIALALVFAGRDGAQRTPKLAALSAHELLAPTGDEDAPTGLGELVLSSAGVTRLPGDEKLPDRLELRLGEVAMSVDGEPAGPRLTAMARRAVVQGLRAAAEAGLAAPKPDDPDAREFSGASLLVEGEREPLAGGESFRFDYATNASELDDDPVHRQALTWLGNADATPVSRNWTPPDRSSLLPPLLAIALAIVTRRPLISLLLGVTAGSILVRLRSGEPGAAGVGSGFADVVTRYFHDRLVDPSNIQIIAFVVLMLAMVGNLTRNGGIRGLMDRLRRLARGPRSTQLSSYGMGLAIFFDDYANTVLVGSTMRPLTDKFRIAREKLAYLVDSTAAPVAGLSVFSTWIAFEVSTFSAQLPAAGLLSTEGYAVFIQTLPYRFYCLFTLVMVFLIAATGRDFGPMLRAERRARSTGQVVRPGSSPMVAERATALDMAAGVAPRAWRALLPLFAFIFVTLFEIARRGGAFGMSASELLTLPGITQVLYDGSGNLPLMIGSAAGFALAALGTLSAGLGFGEVLRAAWTTLRSMGIAFGILYLAWMIGDVCGELGTASFLSAELEGNLNPALLPIALFALAGFIAFSTGSSWGTMSILLPLVVGLSFELGSTLSIGGAGLMVLSIGAVLEGAIFGDHCSPISDTTVLSSISCASDHIDHVRTQAPYALSVMLIAIAVGYLPAAFFGLSPWISLGLGIAAIVLLVLFVGRSTADVAWNSATDSDARESAADAASTAATARS